MHVPCSSGTNVTLVAGCTEGPQECFPRGPARRGHRVLAGERRAGRQRTGAPTTSWELKLRHAARHAAVLKAECKTYRRDSPTVVGAADGGEEGATLFRYEQSSPVPRIIGLVLGDVVHSLRSVLDNLCFALTREDIGREMDRKEERACQFAIYSSPLDFDGFFDSNPGERS